MSDTKLYTSNNVIQFQRDNLSFRFKYLDFGVLSFLPGPCDIKTPEDLIQSLKQLNWIGDHWANVLSMEIYMALRVPKYNLDQDVFLYKSKFIVVNKLATFKELTNCYGVERNMPAFIACWAPTIVKSNDLVVHKDDLHELFPNKTKGISPRILDLFYPKIQMVSGKNVQTR